LITVIPTARSVDLSYLEPLIEAGSRFIVVDDSPGSIRISHPSFTVLTWDDQDRILGADRLAIPRRTGACRDFGFLVAWRESDDDEIIVALDDDCVITEATFAADVVAALSAGPRPTLGAAGRHVNVLDVYADGHCGQFPRGFPYSERVGYRPEGPGPVTDLQPEFNLGMWQGIFDVNAVDKAADSAFDRPDAVLRTATVVVPAGKLVSVCSMNLHFRRALVPAVYELPMHVRVGPNMVVDRYGDIWGGFILKTLMDIRRDAFAVGGPMIFHKKDGDLLRNAWQENICHIVNDEFIALLTEVAGGIGPASYLSMMEALAEGFAEHVSRTSPLLRPYLVELLPRLRAWVRLVRQ
jgi:Reversibly glycosylated polypeptide